MRLLVIGSSQAKHIMEFFSKSNCDCWTFEESSTSIWRRVKNLFRLLYADIVYQVGGLDIQDNKYLRIAQIFHKKIVVHWIGTDVMLIRESFQKEPRKINANCINLAVTEQLCRELQEIGIDSSYVPIFPMQTLRCEKMPVPKQHAVLSYIPAEREDFYGMSIVRELSERFPNIPFYIVANDGRRDAVPPQNLHYLGFLPKDELYRLYEKVSVLLRIPVHDGLPVMMLEAQGLGRTVIHSFDYPFVHCPKGRTIEDIAACLKEVISEPPTVDEASVDYIQSYYTYAMLKASYQKSGLSFVF